MRLRIFFAYDERMRQILHLDFDSFFASVEQQYNAHLRGKPIGVTAQNGRTCIIASSREAKLLGIKTGARSWEAKKICPAITLIPADFPKYWEVSKKFLGIAKDYSSDVELFSIDEVFMDISKTRHLFGGVSGVVARIKNRIRKEIGEYITVSVGISYNKLLSKMASGLAKPARHRKHELAQALRAGPNGVVEIQPADVDKIYSSAKLTDVCGIGEQIKTRLNNIGIYFLWQLRDTPLPFLVTEFGAAEAAFLKNIGLAIDNSPIIPYTQAPEVKSVGRNYCLPKNEYNKQIILQNIYELCEEVALKLRRLNKKARTVRVFLNGSQTISGQKTYQEAYDSGQDFFRLIKRQFSLNEKDYVRQISIGVSNLEDANIGQISLFDSVKRNRRLLSAVDAINERFGHHTIRNGFLLYADKLTTVPNGYMADKYERAKLARTAR